MPSPESAKEHRAHFDRRPLLGSIILDHPPPLTAIGAVFDGRAELIGYAPLAPRAARGKTVEIQFFWRARRAIPEDYWVFVHGDSSFGTARRIFGDHVAAEGKYPPSVWQEGEVVVDRFRIRIPIDYGPSRISLFSGLYLGDYRAQLTEAGQAAHDHENRSLALELTLPE